MCLKQRQVSVCRLRVNVECLSFAPRNHRLALVGPGRSSVPASCHELVAPVFLFVIASNGQPSLNPPVFHH